MALVGDVFEDPKDAHLFSSYVCVVLFCAWLQATPTADTAMFYFYTNELHFSPEFLGRVRLAGSIASLAGIQGIRLCCTYAS